MSKQRGGPRGAFGPGQTVLAPDDGARAGAPPATVRDPAAFAAPPYVPPYGGAGEDRSMVPPPPPARGRRRGRGQGASLFTIGAVSFFVIGGLTTTLAVLKDTSDDDKPAPTVDAPAPTTVAQDPVPSAVPADAGATPPARPVAPGARPGFRTPHPAPRPGGNGPRRTGPMPGPYPPRRSPGPTR